MLIKFRAAGLVWPTLLAACALAVLIGLGAWQMQRKAWKDRLQQGILANSRFDREVVVDKYDPAEWAAMLRGNPLDWSYSRYKFRGRFEHDQERHLYAPDPRLGPGFHVYTPLALHLGGRVLVNRGFVPEALKAASSRLEGQIEGLVVVTGLLRQSAPKATFVPANDAARNIWFWVDVPAMLGCSDARPGQTCTARSELEPGATEIVSFHVDATAEPANPGGWPRGGTTNLDLPNRHLEYALTWFGLAATLIGVYGSFAWGRLRGAERSGRPG